MGLEIVFQRQVLGDVDIERGVLDIGLGAGCVIQVVHQQRFVHMKVFVVYMESWIHPLAQVWSHIPWRRSLWRFELDVPRNMPCAAQIKAEVMQRFNGERYGCVQKMTSPHLFLDVYRNYALHGTRFS